MKLPYVAEEKDFVRHFKDEIWLQAAENVCQRHLISFKYLRRAEAGEHIVFLVDERFVIKIYTPFRDGFRREKSALEFAPDKTSLPLPEIAFAGEIETFNYLVLTQLAGVTMTREIWRRLETRKQIAVLAQLADGLKQLHSHRAEAIDFDWRKFIER